jgi:hypothetical protein
MTAPPPCPQDQNFGILTGFITPGSDTTPPSLAGSITVDVLDPTENDERIRIVETTDPWNLEVDWCLCGRFADLICGCWCVQVFIDDIDGVGLTSGLIASAKVPVSSGTTVEGADTATTCFEVTFNFPAGRVQPGAYDLLVVITLSARDCDEPGRQVQDMLGYAQIPVLVFFDENVTFCPPSDPVIPVTIPET